MEFTNNAKIMITLTTIEGFKPLNNFVLLGNPTSTESIGNLYIDTSYKPEDHVEIINEVMAVPDRLKFNEWETEMQLKVGDKVWVSYLSIIKGERVQVGDSVYVLVPYEKIILTKREDEIVMLNGYVLLEPVTEEVKQSGLIILLKTAKQASKRGIVRYIGPSNKRYTDENHSDDIDIKIGDMIGLKHGYHSKLESQYHQTIGDYWVVQRRDIVAAFDI